MDFFNINLVVSIIPVSIFCIILIFGIFRMIFKLSSSFKLFVMAVVVYLVVTTISFGMLYVSNNGYEFINEKKYHIKAEVYGISLKDKELTVNVLTSTLDKVAASKKVKVTDKTAVFSQIESSKFKKIDFSDILITDTLSITFVYNDETEEITAVKIVKI